MPSGGSATRPSAGELGTIGYETGPSEEVRDVRSDVAREQHADVAVRQHDVIRETRDDRLADTTVPSLSSSKCAKNCHGPTGRDPAIAPAPAAVPFAPARLGELLHDVEPSSGRSIGHRSAPRRRGCR
jgi:hypothetical protein